MSIPKTINSESYARMVCERLGLNLSMVSRIVVCAEPGKLLTVTVELNRVAALMDAELPVKENMEVTVR